MPGNLSGPLNSSLLLVWLNSAPSGSVPDWMATRWPWLRPALVKKLTAATYRVSWETTGTKYWFAATWTGVSNSCVCHVPPVWVPVYALVARRVPSLSEIGEYNSRVGVFGGAVMLEYQRIPLMLPAAVAYMVVPRSRPLPPSLASVSPLSGSWVVKRDSSATVASGLYRAAIRTG